MSLSKIILKESDLVKKSRQCITNQQSLNPDVIGKDDCCELGEWLHGEGKLHYGNLNGFHELLINHAEFHLEARKIVLATKQKTDLEIADMMKDGSVFSILVLKIAHSIDYLNREIKGRRSNKM
jgi:methyl-accepting chemotaxis protein